MTSEYRNRMVAVRTDDAYKQYYFTGQVSRQVHQGPLFIIYINHNVINMDINLRRNHLLRQI